MDKRGRVVDPAATMTRLVPHRLFALTLVAAGLLAPHIARADVPPEESEACEGKTAGQPCTLRGQAGSCQPGKCSRLDYSKGTPPEVVESDCVRCTSDGAANPAPASATGADASSNKTEPPPVSGGRCSFVGEGAGLSLALFGALGLVLRRRRPRG